MINIELEDGTTKILPISYDDIMIDGEKFRSWDELVKTSIDYAVVMWILSVKKWEKVEIAGKCYGVIGNDRVPWRVAELTQNLPMIVRWGRV